MRILFDNNVPLGLRAYLPGHEVFTILEMNWSPELKNGELIDKAEAAGFDLFLTADQNIQYQQNLTVRKLALVALGSNLWPVVRIHAEAIAAAIDKATPQSYQTVAMQILPRPRTTRKAR